MARKRTGLPRGAGLTAGPSRLHQSCGPGRLDFSGSPQRATGAENGLRSDDLLYRNVELQIFPNRNPLLDFLRIFSGIFSSWQPFSRMIGGLSVRAPETSVAVAMRDGCGGNCEHEAR
jgi:hypothetical protein